MPKPIASDDCASASSSRSRTSLRSRVGEVAQVPAERVDALGRSL